MNKIKKGISLIVLVITILVMIILAGVVVVSLQKNNPIEKAKTAKDTSNLSALKEELELYKTNELMLGNKDANNISFTETEVKDILKNIPDNLKGKVAVSNGKLGVYYSKITEEAQDYARENDIFDAEDKIAPDADVYIEERAGKKYVVCDSVDYETDIAKIVCSNGEQKIPNSNYEKIVIAYDAAQMGGSKTTMEKEISKRFKNVTLQEDGNVTKENCNVLVNYGAQFTAYGKEKEPNGEWKQSQKKEQNAIDLYNQGTKEGKILIVTLGNDTSSRIESNPLVKVDSATTITDFTFSNKLVDNIITRKIEKVAKENTNFFRDDSRETVAFKDSPLLTRYFTNAKITENNDCAALLEDKENGRAWIHLQEAGVNSKEHEIEKIADIIKVMITKVTGSRSMEIDVTGVAPGTKYSFTITDLAGNKVIKEITL